MSFSPDAFAEALSVFATHERMDPLMLLCKLTEGECPVGDLANYAGLGLSATSQHLSKLRAEEVVATRRDAQTIYYRLVDPAAIRIIETLSEIYKH